MTLRCRPRSHPRRAPARPGCTSYAATTGTCRSASTRRAWSSVTARRPGACRTTARLRPSTTAAHAARLLATGCSSTPTGDPPCRPQLAPSRGSSWSPHGDAAPPLPAAARAPGAPGRGRPVERLRGRRAPAPRPAARPSTGPATTGATAVLVVGEPAAPRGRLDPLVRAGTPHLLARRARPGRWRSAPSSCPARRRACAASTPTSASATRAGRWCSSRPPEEPPTRAGRPRSGLRSSRWPGRSRDVVRRARRATGRAPGRRR